MAANCCVFGVSVKHLVCGIINASVLPTQGQSVKGESKKNKNTLNYSKEMDIMCALQKKKKKEKKEKEWQWW